MTRRMKNKPTLVMFAAILLGTPCCVMAQDKEPKTVIQHAAKERRDDWDGIKLPDGRRESSTTMVVTVRAEPVPALRYRFIDDEIDMEDRNAAIFYLRAMSFLDQQNNYAGLREFWKKARITAEQDHKPIQHHLWLSQLPSDLPLNEVKEYLKFTDFQVRDLREAQRCKFMSFDRHIEDLENPALLLLPEVNEFRTIMRDQRLRCRVALAENRISDAIEILRQQYAMARHMGQETVLVSNLVGAVVAEYALDDTMHLIQHPESPNLYWALASLPESLASMRNSLGFERRFLFEQIKSLKELDLSPRDEKYGQAVIQQLTDSICGMEVEGWPHQEPEKVRSQLNEMIETSYDKASQYLISVVGVSGDKLKSLYKMHVGLLALKEYYRRRADDMIKWSFVPNAQIDSHPTFLKYVAGENDANDTIGSLTKLAHLFVPSSMMYNAQIRATRKLALLQSVEALRMYAAQNDGAMPDSLANTPYPCPMDPATGKPFEYVNHENHIELIGPVCHVSGLKVQLQLRP